jgi:uncharacterized protein YecE (DUF72 family)
VPGAVRIGCSGWNYSDWRGRFYPADLPVRSWLAFYATRFDTVELNTTFYRLPNPATVERWREVAPDGFLFAWKFGAFGTHRMKLRDAPSWMPNHLDRAARLGPTLGPTLVQLPPRWKRDVGRLEEFLATAPRSMRWALELREPTWIDDHVFDALSRHGWALCIHDLLDEHPFVLTTDWTYIRFHGPRATTQRYRGRYGPKRLSPWADRLAELNEQNTDCFAYFNNDYEAYAVRDAVWLRDAVNSRIRAVH